MHSVQSAPSRSPHSPESPATTQVQSFANTFIQRSRPYLSDEQIEALLPKDSQLEAKDITTRLSACVWIMQVGQNMQFPVRTMATAMILYHRFRLFNRNPFLEHNWMDVAATSLFVACKIEDTLKKSREILAASYNLRHPQAEPINSDNQMLDDGTKRVIGIERMILESSSFDFRYRHAQPLIIKFAKRFNFSKELTQKAWDISIDVYKTLAPLKATPHALALAVLDLAMRLEGEKINIQYEEFEVTRDSVLSIVDDLLDLYTNHRSYTLVGTQYDSNTYLTHRIELNKERQTHGNGHHKHNDRGTHGTVRFMIDPSRERSERHLLDRHAHDSNGTGGSPSNGSS
ncbi:uncharacterized protein H6S33_001702 [Morchella sextelata]|uniref:uncharacterized protein n=1 Tax=Morchella sextelata TaxID=1174677 RepID=UPI001D041313|nr:uncharacterized protein H6S33_001702 [Morchella sextelata]KAH0608568.1 hypothetical protein H6S33_001702 [Morchella sextelata]